MRLNQQIDDDGTCGRMTLFSNAAQDLCIGSDEIERQGS
jgi:hypothetical protein